MYTTLLIPTSVVECYVALLFSFWILPKLGAVIENWGLQKCSSLPIYRGMNSDPFWGFNGITVITKSSYYIINNNINNYRRFPENAFRGIH